MKKKLMMVAVLLGALTLGACVDDNESQSVTDVRKAKAEQLKSIATLNNAQAEAAVIAANAEAEMKKAEAAYQQALANAANASTAEKEMLIEQAKQKFTEELKLIQAEYAAKIAKYNAQKEKWDNELWNKTETHIQSLYYSYTGALNNVNSYTKAKIEAQVQKSQTEALLITSEESLKQTLAGLNIEKAQQERTLAKLKAMKEKQPSKDEYLAKLDELEKQAYDIVQNKLPEVNAAKKTAKDVYETAIDAMEEGEYSFAKAAEELNSLRFQAGVHNMFTTYVSQIIALDKYNEYQAEFGYYPNGQFTFGWYELAIESEIQYATIGIDDYFNRILKSADTAIKTAEGEAWEKDDNGNIIQGGDYSSVKGAESALAYRKQEIAVQQKSIDAKKKEITTAEAAGTPDKALIEALKNELQSLEDYMIILKDTRSLEAKITEAGEILADKKADKADIEENQKEYKANLVILKDAAALKAYQDEFKALEELAITYIDKQAAVAPVTTALNEMGFDTNGDKNGTGEYAYVKQLLDGILDVQSLIDNCNTRLAEIAATVKLGNLNNLVTLQNTQAYIYNPLIDNYEWIDVYCYVLTGAGTITLEDAITVIDAQIKVIDERIRIQQTLADKYKAELDALIGTASAE